MAPNIVIEIQAVLLPATIIRDGDRATIVLARCGGEAGKLALAGQADELAEALERLAAQLRDPAPGGASQTCPASYPKRDGGKAATSTAMLRDVPGRVADEHQPGRIAARRDSWDWLTPAGVIAYLRRSPELMRTLGDLIDGLEKQWLAANTTSAPHAAVPEGQLGQDLAMVLDQADPTTFINDKGRVVLAEIAQILTGQRKTAGDLYYRCRAVADVIEAEFATAMKTTTTGDAATKGRKKAG